MKLRAVTSMERGIHSASARGISAALRSAWSILRRCGLKSALQRVTGIMLPGVFLAVAAAAQPDGFQQAATACAAGDYSAAADGFAELAQLKPASGTLQNLGLAEWRRGRSGHAILAWERALWVDPFNDAARENLRFVRKAAHLEEPELAWFEAASTWLPANVWAVLAGISLWFAVGMITLPRVFRWQRANWTQGLAAAGIAIFLLCLPSLAGVETRSHIGFALEKETPLRLTPTRDAQTISLLAEGQPARWERARGDYLLIRTPYGKGWIERGQFGRICPQ